MRLTGKTASVKLGSVTVADMEELTINISPEFLESRGWGETYKQRSPDGSDVTLTAKKWMTATTANVGEFIANSARTVDATTPYTVTVYAYTGGIIFVGLMWFGEATMNMPRGLYTEDVTMVAAEKPTYIAGYTPL